MGASTAKISQRQLLLKKAQDRHQTKADQPEQAAQRFDAAFQARFVEQVSEAVARVTEEIVGMLMDLPALHGGEDQLAARLQHARHFIDADARFLQMFQHLNVDDGVERVVAERQFGDVAQHFDFRVVPGLVADAAIQADVAGVSEERSVGTLAGAGVQDMRAGGKLAGGGGEVFQKLGMKRIDPAHDEGGNEGLDQLPKFRFKHALPLPHGRRLRPGARERRSGFWSGSIRVCSGNRSGPSGEAGSPENRARDG